MPFNAKKNRYKDIVPFDYCRVMLPQIPGVDGSDCINASYLKAGEERRCTIIAAQGPLPQTVVDFWRMLWSHNIKVVVMAANEYEGGKKKCEKYWPDIGNPIMFDQIHVEQVKTDTKHAPDFIVHELKISCQGDVRYLHHFQYVTWPDHGVPESPIAVMRMLAAVREKQPLEDEWPIVIHCSAGCGRTGTLAAIDHVWGHLKSKDLLATTINVFNIVSEYRKRRQSIVQTPDQYLYVYKAVLDLVKNILQGIDPLAAGGEPGGTGYNIGSSFRDSFKTFSRDQAMSLSKMMVPSIDAESKAAAAADGSGADEEAIAETAAETAATETKANAPEPRYSVAEFGDLSFPKRIGKPLGERKPVGFALVC